MSNNNGYNLMEFPNGDVDEEGDFEDGDVEDGDVDEQGGPRSRRKKKRHSNKQQSVARRSSKIARSRSASAMRKMPVQPGDPSVARAAMLKEALLPPEIVYVGLKGARLISCSLGNEAALRPAEHDAVKASIFEATPFSPQTFGFTSGVLAVDAALSTSNGGPLPNSTLFTYAGLQITLAASVLNATPGAPVSLVIELGAGYSLSLLFEIQEGVYAVDLSILNGVLIAGKPRFFAPRVPVAASASGNYDVTFSSLPSNYTPIARFLQPGDEVVDKLLGLL